MSNPADRVHLLTVEDPLWQATASMLILPPIFLHADRSWHDREEKVWVITPEGLELEATAHVAITHVNIRGDDIPMEMRWPVRVWLTDRSTEEVPVGSRIECSPEMRQALGPEADF